MLRIDLHPHVTREDLLQIHQELYQALGEVELVLARAGDYSSLGEMQYTALLQAVVTWSSRSRQPELVVPEESMVNLKETLRGSDLHLVAIALAKKLNGTSRPELGSQFEQELETAFESRNYLHASPAPSSVKSIVLATHMARYSISPDLHVLKGIEPTIDESARTLYHDVWRSPDDSRSLRKAFPTSDEVELPEGTHPPTHVVRKNWPRAHPLRASGAEFSPLISRAISPRGVAQEIYAKRLTYPEMALSGLGSVLYEIVQNTQWHAIGPRKSESVRGCRILRFREQVFRRSDLAIQEGQHSALTRYLSSVLDVPSRSAIGSAESVTLAIVSVIDHGIGLAASAANALNQKLSGTEDDELGYLIRALSKQFKVSNRPLGNIGLPLVQQMLSNLDGYMSIRTGRIEISRDFIASPLRLADIAKGEDAPLRFIDWVPENYEEFRVGPRAGTSVTFMMPVDYTLETS